MSVSADDLLTLIPLSYAIPALIVYMLTVGAMLLRLKGPFYRLLAINGIYVRFLVLTGSKLDRMTLRQHKFIPELGLAEVAGRLLLLQRGIRSELPTAVRFTAEYRMVPNHSVFLSALPTALCVPSQYIRRREPHDCDVPAQSLQEGAVLVDAVEVFTCFLQLWKVLLPISVITSLVVPLVPTVAILVSGAQLYQPNDNVSMPALLQVNDWDVEVSCDACFLLC